MPGDAFDDFAGRTGVVELENGGSARVQARWEDAGVPQIREYPAVNPEKLPAFPDGPAKLVPVGPQFLQALDDAARCAARDNVRYALRKLQMRGSSGEIIASDGRQLLVQKGFTFPWQDDYPRPRPVRGSATLRRRPFDDLDLDDGEAAFVG